MPAVWENGRERIGLQPHSVSTAGLQETALTMPEKEKISPLTVFGNQLRL